MRYERSDEMRCMTMHRKIEFSVVKNACLKMSNDIFKYMCVQCICLCIDYIYMGTRNGEVSYNGIHIFQKRPERKSENSLVSIFIIFECSTTFCQ